MSIRTLFMVALMGIIGALALLLPTYFDIGAQASDIALRLHSDLDTGLTACALEAGNGYDLTAFGVTLPFIVHSVTVWAQTFGGESSGSVALSLYGDDDFNPTNGATLLADAGSITVNGGAPAAYSLAVGDVQVNQPYLYVIVRFDTPVVINASSSGTSGISFSSGCDETGLAALTHTIGSDTARLAIEVQGYSTIVEPTEEITAEATVENTAESAVEMTAEATIESTAESTVESTAEATVESTPSVTELSSATPTTEMTAESTLAVTQDPLPTLMPTSAASLESTALPTAEETTALPEQQVTATAAPTDAMALPESEVTEVNGGD